MNVMLSAERKNVYLDAENSDDGGDLGYASEEELEKGGRAAKRRRLSYVSEADDRSESGVEDEEDHTAPEAIQAVKRWKAGAKHADVSEVADEVQDHEEPRGEEVKASHAISGLSKQLSKKNLIATEKAIKKSGVVYISRVPPYMKPIKLRTLLEPFGKINRIFLAPEDPQAHSRRVKAGGNKRKLFTEGWVEFVSKKDAKNVCELLNGSIIGGKKGNFYHDDMWNLLYLKNFKWHHLTEQVAREQAERASRMRAEISKTTRENKLFVANVERSRMLDGMEAKAMSKRKVFDNDPDAQAAIDNAQSAGTVKQRKQTFKQVPKAKKRKPEAETAQGVDQLQRVLSRIF